ncbi:MAG: NADH-quinone oxidoreductase subunit J [Acidobacteriota bacterium]
MDYHVLFFYLLAAVTLLSGLMVILMKNPVHSAIFLIITFLAVAGIFVLLNAEFLAAVQVLVYAGGIMVLFLFVIMLVTMGEQKTGMSGFRKFHVLISILLALLLASSLIFIFFINPFTSTEPQDTSVLNGDGGNLETVGVGLYMYYLLPFEVASVLLLVAMIGAVVLAKYRI